MTKSRRTSPPRPSGTRTAAVRIKKTNRSDSSQRWLTRQLNDPYVAAAKAQGFRSRAAFKLQQLNEKFHLIRAGDCVVDLGAAPGGWSQIAAKIIGGNGRLIAVDILPMEAMPGVTSLQGDFTSDALHRQVASLIPGGADLVLSDMAEPTTGHQRTDHLRIMRLAESAFDFAEMVLRPGGALVIKLFQGGAERELLDRLKLGFASVRHAKPAASRSDSSECYIVAQDFAATRRPD
ncbi:MAG: RlmE family RNA methyltransferase [Candidatus Symbiobacter sp.]|nr:RlmE family RNA methyltransferase [Candidatus Symbiobacter sp.]